MQSQYRVLMAKTGRDVEAGWLPLWMHLRDTAGVMKMLVLRWVSRSVFRAAKLNDEQFLATAIFLAAIHDIGKATSCFQSVITKVCIQKRNEITLRIPLGVLFLRK